MEQLAFDSEQNGESRRSALCQSLWLLTLPVLTGALLAAAFPPLDWSWLAWFALVPLAVALADKRQWVEPYLGAYLGGLVFQLVHLDWIRTGYGDSGLSSPRATQWLAQGVGLALVWPFVMFVSRPFVRRTRLPMAVALPIVWVAFEFARKHLWAIVDATGYPYGQLGLTQAHLPRLIQVADLGGVYAVTAVIAAVNGLWVDLGRWLLARRGSEQTQMAGVCGGRASCPPLAAAIMLASVVAGTLLYGTWRVKQTAPADGPIVCLMPPSSAGALDDLLEPEAAGEPPDAKASAAAAPVRGSEAGKMPAPLPADQAKRLPADLLIWSEGAYAHPLVADTAVTPGESEAQTALRQFEKFAADHGAALVIGCDRKFADDGASTRRCNSAAVIDPARGCVGFYDKLWLVPFSEFRPRGRPALGRMTMDRYAHGTELPVFTIEVGTPRRAYHFASAICYDTCFPESFRKYMRPAAGAEVPQFFVVSACESHDSAMRLQKLLLRLAQFRAIETRRAFVRNAEGGYSGIIDGNGTLVAGPPRIDFAAPCAIGRAPLDERASLYTRWGDWLPIVCAATLIGTFGAALIRRGGERAAAVT